MKNNYENSKYAISILAIVGLLFIVIVLIADICTAFNINMNEHVLFIKLLLISTLIGGAIIITHEMNKISK